MKRNLGFIVFLNNISQVDGGAHGGYIWSFFHPLSEYQLATATTFLCFLKGVPKHFLLEGQNCN